MRKLDALYSSMRLDRRVRIVRANLLDVTVWARRIEAHVTRELSLTDPLPENSIVRTYLIRWRGDVANAPESANFRATELPAAEGDNGFRVRRIEEVGRRKYLKLELSLL